MIESTNWTPTAGDEVVVYTTGPTGTPARTRASLITKVNAKTFRVEGEDLLFDVDTKESAPQGGRWGWTRNVIPRDTDTARQLLHDRQVQRSRFAAEVAFDAWRTDRTPKLRAAAIEALQNVVD